MACNENAALGEGVIESVISAAIALEGGSGRDAAAVTLSKRLVAVISYSRHLLGMCDSDAIEQCLRLAEAKVSAGKRQTKCHRETIKKCRRAMRRH